MNALQGETSGCLSSDLGSDVTAALDVQVAPGGAAALEVAGDRDRWEQGRPDFKGADAFENILKKIDSTMSMSSGESRLIQSYPHVL